MSLESEINKSVELLSKGKVICYPTDTIWGIGCDATNSKAVQKIYKIKNRSESKSMILLLDSKEELKKYVKNVPPVAYELIDNAQSPLTIVYSGAMKVSKHLIADDGSIAIRIVKDEYCSAVVKKLGKPIVSSSANVSGQPSPKVFEDITEEIKQEVDHVVGVFQDRIRSLKASTIIRLDESGSFEILRS